MKIAVCAITLDLLSGGERRKVELARGLEERGYKVTLYVKNTLVNEGWHGLKLPSKIEKYSKKPIEADFIFMANFDLPFEQAQKAKGQKVWMTSYFWPQTYQFLQDPNVIKIAHSTWHADWLKRKYNQESVRALGGVNTNFFTPLRGGPTANIKNRENFIIAQKGRAGDKNYNMVELAFKQLRTDVYKLEPASGKDQYELREKYRKATFFVSAEMYPIFCWNNPAAEAMACGSPVIVVDHPAIKDHCLHRKTAEVVNLRVPSITEELTRVMQLLIDNEDYRKSLAENAYRYIHNFSYNQVIDTIEAEILTDRKRPKLKTLRLNLGCGPKEKHLSGYINIDKEPQCQPDLLLELEEADLPYAESSVDNIYTSHCLEHIKNFIPLVEEIYRVCKPNAEVEIFVPYGLTDSGIADPYHGRLLCERSFDYFDKTSPLFIYPFKCNFKVMSTQRNQLNHIHLILKAIKDEKSKKSISKITYFPLGNMTTASTRLRCYMIAERLRKRGYKTSFDKPEPTDVAIFQKRTSLEDLESAKALKEKGAKIILDMCDPMWTAGQEKSLLDFIPIADCITTSSSKIADYFKDKAKRVEVICEGIDWKNIPQVEKDKKPTVCWCGSIYSAETEHCLDILTEPLNRLHKEIPFDFRIITDGEVKLDKLDFAPQVIEFSLENYLTGIAKSHIGVIPYPDTEWCKSKSNNKVILFMALGLPVVCSSIPAYEEVIVDRENGYIIKDNDSEKWYQALKVLLTDEEERKRVIKEGKKKAEEFSVNKIVDRWEELVKTL